MNIINTPSVRPFKIYLLIRFTQGKQAKGPVGTFLKKEKSKTHYCVLDVKCLQHCVFECWLFNDIKLHDLRGPSPFGHHECCFTAAVSTTPLFQACCCLDWFPSEAWAADQELICPNLIWKFE